jgi:hypothetical protein
MRTWLAAVGFLAVGGSALAVPLLAGDDDDTKKPEDKARIERELRDLEEQRARVDARIRELRRQGSRAESLRVIRPGTGEAVTIPRFNFNFDDKNLSEEQRREIRRAMEQAHKAVEEAMKNVPKGQNFVFSDKDFVIPRVEALRSLKGLEGLESLKELRGLEGLEALKGAKGNSVRVYVDKDGKTRKFEGPMTQEERDFIKRDMGKLKAEIRNWTDGGNSRVVIPRIEIPRIQVSPTTPPTVYTVPARPRTRVEVVPSTPRVQVVPSVPRTYIERDGGNAELRSEIRRLREEVERLRDEVRRGRPIGNDKDERTRRFLSPYGDA